MNTDTACLGRGGCRGSRARHADVRKMYWIPSSDFLLQVAKVCRAQAQVARIEHDTNEEAKFLLLGGALEGKAAEHQAKSVQKLPESHGR